MRESEESVKIGTFEDLISSNSDSVATQTQIMTNRGSYLSNACTPDVTARLSAVFSQSQDWAGGQPSYLIDGTCGIDKTRIMVEPDFDTFTISTFMDRLITRRGNSGSATKGEVEIPGLLTAYVQWNDYCQKLSIEFNPSHVTIPLGLGLCPFYKFSQITEIVIRAIFGEGDRDARPVFWKRTDDLDAPYEFEEGWERFVSVHRLDIARDFIVSDKRFSLEQLRRTYPSRSRNQASEQYRNDGRLNTLTYPVSENTPEIMLYDKHQERLRNPKPEFPEIAVGTFRFEISVPRQAWVKNHTTTLNLFTPSRLDKWIRGKWEISKFWTNVVWEGQSAMDAHLLGVSTNRVNELIGFAHCLNHGIPMSYSNREIRRLRAECRELGITLDGDLSDIGVPYGHLDFMSGDIKKPLPADFSLSNGNLFSIIDA
jgi:hypothetical protein